MIQIVIGNQRTNRVSDEEPDNLSEDEKEESFNAREFQKFIQKIFPSKSGTERLRQLEKLDKLVEKESLRKGCKKKKVVKRKKKVLPKKKK